MVMDKSNIYKHLFFFLFLSCLFSFNKRKLPKKIKLITFDTKNEAGVLTATVDDIIFVPFIMPSFDSNTGTIKFFSPSDEMVFCLSVPVACDKVFLDQVKVCWC